MPEPTPAETETPVCRRCKGRRYIPLADGGMFARPSGMPRPEFPCPDCNPEEHAALMGPAER